MPLFDYKITEHSGTIKSGKIEASSKLDANEQLTELGIIVSLTQEKKENKLLKFIKFKKKVSDQDVINYTRQVKTQLTSGLSLVEALQSIESNVENPQMKEIITKLQGHMASGKSYSDSLGMYSNIFPESYLAMVKAGELSGKLEDILDKLTGFLVWEKEIVKKVKGALTYPISVIITALIALLFIVAFVVPKFASFFGNQNKQLPLITRALLFTNTLIMDYWLITIGVIIAAIFAYKRAMQTPKLKYKIHQFYLTLPLFGPLMRKYMTARFSKVFALLYNSGVTVIDSMAICRKLFDNAVYQKEIDRIMRSLSEGSQLSVCIVESTFFQKLAKQMISIGERSDNVTDMMTELGNFYSEDIEYVIENLFAIIQPILIVVIGGLLCVIALGMFMPMWDVMGFDH